MSIETQVAKLEHADSLDLTIRVLKHILNEELTKSTKDMITTFVAHYTTKSEKLIQEASPAQRMAEIQHELSQEVANV